MFWYVCVKINASNKKNTSWVLKGNKKVLVQSRIFFADLQICELAWERHSDVLFFTIDIIMKSIMVPEKAEKVVNLLSLTEPIVNTSCQVRRKNLESTTLEILESGMHMYTIFCNNFLILLYCTMYPVY